MDPFLFLLPLFGFVAMAAIVGTPVVSVRLARAWDGGWRLMAALPDLVEKDLVCWCAPEACHGDVLLELTNPKPAADARVVLAATGHRPGKLGVDAGIEARLLRLAGGYLEATDRPKAVISGMAIGWDTAWALAATEIGIPLIAAVPLEDQPGRWPLEARRVHERLLRGLQHVDRVRRAERLREHVPDASQLEHRADAPARDHARPGRRGAQDHARGAEAAEHLVRDRLAVLGHGEEVLLRVLDGLRDRERHLARLPVADADPVDLVPDDDERGEREPPAALHDLGDAVDLDDSLLQLARFVLEVALDLAFNSAHGRSPPEQIALPGCEKRASAGRRERA